MTQDQIVNYCLVAYLIVGALLGGAWVMLGEHFCPTWNELLVGLFVGAFVAVPCAVVALAVSPIIGLAFGLGWASDIVGRSKWYRAWIAFLDRPICRPTKIKI